MLRHADDDVFMLWQNEPSVIIGKNQNAYAEVDTALAKEQGIHIARRITGGGAVYHDLGNINYTFISPNGAAKPLDFEYFTRPIISALAELGVEATLGGRNDLECCGRKFSGNAQHAEGGRILHHGTLLFDTNPAVMSSVLKVDREKLEHKGVRSVAARVVNLCEVLPEGITLDGLLARLEASVCSELGAMETGLPVSEEIDELYRRNASPEWIFSEKRFLTGYTLRRKKKFPFGLVEAVVELEREAISNIVISGDFFGTSPIEELEATLIGKDPRDLAAIDPSPYISGMTAEALSELLG